MSIGAQNVSVPGNVKLMKKVPGNDVCQEPKREFVICTLSSYSKLVYVPSRVDGHLIKLEAFVYSLRNQTGMAAKWISYKIAVNSYCITLY